MNNASDRDARPGWSPMAAPDPQPVHFVLGTPLASWMPVARALLGDPTPGAAPAAEAADPGPLAVLDRATAGLAAQGTQPASVHLRLARPPTGALEGLHPQLCWALSAVASQFPQARYLIFVHGPARALARWIGDGAAGSSEQALAAWCDGARRIVRHVQAHRRQCLVVDADEAVAHASAVVESAARSLELQLQPGGLPPTDAGPRSDPVVAAVSEWLAGKDPAARALFDELQALCEPLAPTLDATDATGTNADDVLGSLRQALTAPAAIMAAEQDARQLRQELDRLRVQSGDALAARQLQLSRLRADLAASRGEVGTLRRAQAAAKEREDTLDARLISSLAERERVLERMLRVQQRLEAVFGELTDARQALDRSRAELGQTRLAATEAAAALSTARTDVERLRGEKAALGTQLAERDAEAETLKRSMAEAEQARRDLATELGPVRAEVDALRQALQAAQAELVEGERRLQQSLADLARADEATRELQALRQQEAGQREEAARLLAELHRTQEDLEQAVTATNAETERAASAEALLAQKDSELARALADGASESARRQRLEQELIDLGDRLAAARDAHADAAAALQQWRDRYQRLESDRSGREAELHRAADQARNGFEAERIRAAAEQRSLQQHLHLVQEELEQIHLRAEQWRAMSERALPPFAALPDTAALSVLGTGGDEVHRHLEIRIRGAFGADANGTDLLARLVEHRGRPGLALLRVGDEPPPLAQWQPHGTDAERPYMLFVPADAPGRQALLHLGTRDWLRVVGLAALLASELRLPPISDARWAFVAERLCAALAALPDRFRYDGLSVTDPGERLAATFRNAMHGRRDLGTLSIEWAPGASPQTLRLLRPTGSQSLRPCLACWPAAEGGGWAPHYDLPVGGAGWRRRFRAFLTDLPEGDRQLLVAVLDALPALADGLDASRQGAVRAAARRLARAGSEAATTVGLRTALRAVGRRVGLPL